VALAGLARTESRSKAEILDDLSGKVTDPLPTLELGSWIGILTVDMELSDYGMALRWLASSRDDSIRSPPRSDGVNELLFWLLLRVDTLLLALLQEWLDQPRADMPRIEEAIGRLLADAQAAAEPDQLVPALHLSEFLRQLDSEPDLGTKALSGRLEILATLDLIRQGDEPTSPPEPDPRLGALVSNLRGRPLTTAGALTFLDQGYFSGLAADPPQSTMRATSPDQALLWMVRAYLSIRRPLGFTPGRPISVLACCLALREGIAMEIRDAYDCIYEAAARWSEYLHFSGGSRFDREFLIRIDPVLEELLESELDEVAASRGR